MKAVVLYSGGLDSSLALVLVKEWGAQVFPLHIAHKFLSIKTLPEVPDLKIIDVTSEFIELVRNPKFGYGRNLNPCIDCRILMLKKAKEYLKEIQADFIVTGEVLNQRPMSQRFEILVTIEKETGLEGLVVRPLSGGLLPATIPEKSGLINREVLLKIKGRSRKFELFLAQKKQITQFFLPGGGCLVTDPGFSRRLADLMRFNEKISSSDVELLKIGRHFRLSPDTKLIVGREQEENQKLENLMNSKDVFLLFVPETGSPNALLLGDKKYLKTAASIIARYCDKNKEANIEVWYKNKKKANKIYIQPIIDEELAKWRIV